MVFAEANKIKSQGEEIFFNPIPDDEIVVVEPHSDDFALNLLGFCIMNPLHIITVITVAVSPKNYNKTFLLEKFVNIRNICLGLRNLEKEDFKKGETLEEVFFKKNGMSFEELKEKIKREAQNKILILPMGKRDPLHNLISKIDGDYYYREIPYFWTNKELVKSNYEYRKFQNHYTIQLPEEAVNLKWKIFETVYKDQLGMLKKWRPYYKTIKDEEIYF
jgi:hypothetical protein